jgi:glycerophosphoryl diester phosphodiesterase
MLQPLLRDGDPRVLQESLMALGRMPGEVPAEQLLPLLENGNPAVRGAAAVALARHQPETALKAIPGQLRLEKAAAIKLGEDYQRRGRPRLSRAETDEIMGHFRCQMKMMQALSSLEVAGAKEVLQEEGFRPGNDSAQMDAIVATFQLWDRIGTDTHTAIEALGSSDTAVADRTEWMLVQAGSVVLPEVRKALESGNSSVRERAIRIVAWQGDVDSVARLKAMRKTDSDPTKDELIAWAIDKIETLHPAGVGGSR